MHEKTCSETRNGVNTYLTSLEKKFITDFSLFSSFGLSNKSCLFNNAPSRQDFSISYRKHNAAFNSIQFQFISQLEFIERSQKSDSGKRGVKDLPAQSAVSVAATTKDRKKERKMANESKIS
jgi:hypothetical protein